MVFVAGLIRGFTGFGFSIAAVPLLSLIMPPAQAVPIVLLLQLLVSMNGLKAAARICDWRSIRALSLGALVATPLGAWALATLRAHQCASASPLWCSGRYSCCRAAFACIPFAIHSDAPVTPLAPLFTA
jgi:uncharacterized membrane protein YfcA